MIAGKQMLIDTGVSDRPPAQLLLGQDVPGLFSLLGTRVGVESPKSAANVEVVSAVAKEVVAVTMHRLLSK